MMKKFLYEVYKCVRWASLVILLMCGLVSVRFDADQGLLFVSGYPAWAEDNVVDEQEEQTLASQAELAILNLAAKNEWFHHHVKEAKAIFMAPELYQGRVLTGGSGILIVRLDDGWSQKAFYRVEVPDLGVQIGSDRLEVVLLVNTHLGLTSFYAGSFTLGEDLKISRGPVQGDPSIGDITGDVVAFTKFRSQKAFTDIPLQGIHISVSNDFNSSYYGTAVQPDEIFSAKSVSELGLSGIVSALRHQPVKGN